MMNPKRGKTNTRFVSCNDEISFIGRAWLGHIPVSFQHTRALIDAMD